MQSSSRNICADSSQIQGPTRVTGVLSLRFLQRNLLQKSPVRVEGERLRPKLILGDVHSDQACPIKMR